MSARNLLPVAAALAEPVTPELSPASKEGLLARTVVRYRRLRGRVRRLRERFARD